MSVIQNEICDIIQTNPLESSLFIPCIPDAYLCSENNIEQLCYNIGLSNIKRVDISTVKNENGTVRNMAFIHFHVWHNTYNIRLIRDAIYKNGYYLYTLPNGKFIKLMFNNNPITETDRNIHQLADDLARAEITIIEQSNRIRDLENMIRLLQREIDPDY